MENFMDYHKVPYNSNNANLDLIYFQLKDYFHENEFIRLNDGNVNLEDASLLMNEYKQELNKNEVEVDKIGQDKNNRKSQTETNKTPVKLNAVKSVEKEKNNKETKTNQQNQQNHSHKKHNSNFKLINGSILKIPLGKYYLKNYVKNEKVFFEHRNSLKSYNPILKNLTEYNKQKDSLLQVIPESRGSKMGNISFVNEEESSVKKNSILKDKYNRPSSHNLNKDAERKKSSLTPSTSVNRKSSILSRGKKSNGTPVKVAYKISNETSSSIIERSDTSSNFINFKALNESDLRPSLYAKNLNFSFDLGYSNLMQSSYNLHRKDKSINPTNSNSKTVEQIIEEDYNIVKEGVINFKKLTHLVTSESMNMASPKYELLKNEISKIKVKLLDSAVRRSVFTKISQGKREKFQFLNDLFKTLLKEEELARRAAKFDKRKSKSTNSREISSPYLFTHSENKTQVCKKSLKKRSTTFMTKLSVIEENKQEARNSTNSEINGGIFMEHMGLNKHNKSIKELDIIQTLDNKYSESESINKANQLFQLNKNLIMSMKRNSTNQSTASKLPIINERKQIRNSIFSIGDKFHKLDSFTENINITLDKGQKISISKSPIKSKKVNL